MKSFFSTAFILLLLLTGKAQTPTDTVSMQALYTNQVFYSLDNGEVANIDNNDWNIAFALHGTGAAGSAILLNEANTQLWTPAQDTSWWDSFDTTGHANWEELLNSDTSWTNGAFNKYRGAASGFDLGWGILNPSNNYWTFGDSLYVAKLGDGSYRKIWIESLKTGVWEFTYADVDGNNENTVTITKADYPNKNFIYFSLENDQIIDREPENTTWDLTFAKHRDEVMPGMIVSVTSVFNNRYVWSAKANEADYNAAVTSTTPVTDFNQNVTNIGREWKKYSSATGWTVYDSIAYFVYDQDSTDFYRIVFTEFGGMGDGITYFNKEHLEGVGITTLENDINISLYPNPARDQVTLLADLPTNQNLGIKLYSVNGQLVHSINQPANSGIGYYTLPVSDFNRGLYLLQIEGEGFSATKKLLLE